MQHFYPFNKFEIKPCKVNMINHLNDWIKSPWIFDNIQKSVETIWNALCCGKTLYIINSLANIFDGYMQFEIILFTTKLIVV